MNAVSGFSVGDMFNQWKKEQVQAVPAGTYVMEITKVNVRGDNALMPFFKVVEGPMTGTTVLAGQFTLTEKAAGIFFQNLRGCGLTNEFFAQSPSMDTIAQALVGRVVQAELTIDQWNGEDRNKLPIGKIKFLRMGGPAGLGGGPALPSAVPAAPPAPVAAAPAPAPAAVPDAPSEAAPAAPEAAPEAQAAPAVAEAPVAAPAPNGVPTSTPF